MTILKRFKSKKPTSLELALYLGVTKSAVSQYSAKKRNLMLLGLWIKKEIKANKVEDNP
jgi:predicted transcriptional regulator